MDDSKPPPSTPAKSSAVPSPKKRARTTTSASSSAQPLHVFVLDIAEATNGGGMLLYGCTADRQSVLLRVQGFRHSFFLEIPGLVSAAGLPREVEHDVRARVRGDAAGFTMEVVRRRSLVTYRRDAETHMLRIYLATQRSATNRILSEFKAVCKDHHVEVYETNVDVETRFSLDSGIRCGHWLEVPHGNDDKVPLDAADRQSGCDVELGCTWDGHVLLCHDQPVLVHAFTEGPRWSGLPPLKMLSLSLDRYPTSLPDSAWADKGEDCPDPIRMVGAVFTYENGGGGPHSHAKILMLNTEGLGTLAASARGTSMGGGWATRLYDSEKALLQAVEDLVLREDPSMLTGFDVGETLKVLLGRAEALKMRGYGAFSRRKHVKVTVKDQQSYGAKWVKSKARMSATSNQEWTEVHCPGRVVLDPMRVIQMGEALRLYTIGSIAMHVLRQTFEVLAPKQREALLASDNRLHWNRAMQAGLSPALLALDVLSKKNGVAELVEVARVTGLPLANVYIRGQMARVTSLLQIHATRHGVVIPTSTVGALDKTTLAQCALLLDPSHPTPSNPDSIGTVGLHTDPVAVLDFRSLYPSIMVEHNLCYSTLVQDPRQVQDMDKASLFTTPMDAQFVSTGTRQGVVPRLLADLLQARRHAQGELKDPRVSAGEKRVLDARQKAFKLAANAVYGFTGANVNPLFSRELGDSVLALGREYMSRIIQLVGRDFPQLQVVYGDTDSVFVKYPGWSAADAMAHSRQVLTPALNSELPGGVQVKHEKVLAPLLMQHIRRYAGYEVTDGEGGHGRRLEIKGMEAVARNTMPFLVDLMKRTLTQVLDSAAATGHVDVERVKAYVREQVTALMTNKPDLYRLTWTKGLWRLGEYDAKLPHVHLIEKLEELDPRRQFRVGERVAYVFVQREAGAPLYKKAESPALALAQNMTLDLAEYLKQVRMPMVRILQLVMPPAEAEELFKPTFRAAPAGQVSSASSISHFFFSSAAQCLGCRAVLPAGERSAGGPLCDACKAYPLKTLLPIHETLQTCETEHQRAYSHCSGCQRGSRHWEVLCPNETCPVMYKREKFSRERQEAAERLKELEAALLRDKTPK